MSEQFVCDFERALKNFTQRLGEERASLLTSSSRLAATRQELIEMDRKLEEKKAELAKETEEAKSQADAAEKGRIELRGMYVQFETMKREQGEKDHHILAMINREKDVLAAKELDLRTREEALRKQKEAMRSIVG